MLNTAQKLLPQFLAESTELLAGISQFLKAVEEGRQMTVGSLRKAYRCAHTLRGTSALVKLETVRRIALLVEDTLEIQLQKKQTPGRSKVELLNRALLSLQEQINLVRNGQEIDPDTGKDLEKAFAQFAPLGAKPLSKPSTSPCHHAQQVNGEKPQTTENVSEPPAESDEVAEDIPMNVCCRFQTGQWDLYLPMADMLEIAQLPEVVPLPFAPTYVRGLINLRGKVIPIIDLSSAWGGTTVDLGQCNLVIARTADEDLGFLADGMPHLSPVFEGDFFDLAKFVEEHRVTLPS